MYLFRVVIVAPPQSTSVADICRHACVDNMPLHRRGKYCTTHMPGAPHAGSDLRGSRTGRPQWYYIRNSKPNQLGTTIIVHVAYLFTSAGYRRSRNTNYPRTANLMFGFMNVSFNPLLRLMSWGPGFPRGWGCVTIGALPPQGLFLATGSLQASTPYLGGVLLVVITTWLFAADSLSRKVPGILCFFLGPRPFPFPLTLPTYVHVLFLHFFLILRMISAARSPCPVAPLFRCKKLAHPAAKDCRLFGGYLWRLFCEN